MRAAQEWAAGFTFSEVTRTTDAKLFAHVGFDFAKLCEVKHDRLTEERVRRSLTMENFGDDFRRMLRIARGVRIETPPDFLPCSVLPPLRRKYKVEVPNAVNKLLGKQWDAGTVVILPTELVRRYIPGVHFSFQHWTTKAGKACGRCLCDVANAPVDEVPLNGLGREGKQWLRDRLEKLWGKIVHPTVESLARMVVRAVAKFGLGNVILWKMDLAGAFNLMNFHHTAARLLAFELTDGLSVIHTTGMFGWTGTPYVFQCITRVLCKLSNQLISGDCDWYVDDSMGISPTVAVHEDLAVVKTTACDLLGSTAIADDKTEMDTKLVWIGWLVDAVRMTVTISERNMLKTVYAFFAAADVNLPVSLQVVERMASLASRYAMLCPHMVPYTSALHSAKKQYNGSHSALLCLPPLARSDVELWRAFLCLLHFDSAQYSRSLYTFLPQPPSVLIEYDASLDGYGVGVSIWDAESGVFELRGYTSLVAPFPVSDDSSRQNCQEYTAVMLGLLLAKKLGIASGFSFDITGDNTTSLSWCRRGRVASEIARRANVGFSLLAVCMNALVAETTHIAGVDNVVYDGLSRGKTGLAVGLPEHLYMALPLDSPIVQYVRLCDPAVPLDHTGLSVQFLDILSNL
jgi:hypothetical protein